jgi:ATP-dependent DNA helicase RecQ
MVATNAFGMGIDQRDTRFVVHLQLPANLGAYYQESGRAGRDGLDASCTLLFHHADKRVQQFLLAKHYPDANDLKALSDTARQLAEHGPVSFQRLAEALGHVAAGKLKVALKLLKDARLLRQNRRLAYLPTSTVPTPALLARMASMYAHKMARDRAALDQMVSYGVSATCRWKLLLDYFHDALPDFERCGHCDNCRKVPEVSVLEIHDDEFDHRGAATSPPRWRCGSAASVTRFGVGTVVAATHQEVTMRFPEHGTKTFLADYVKPV